MLPLREAYGFDAAVKLSQTFAPRPMVNIYRIISTPAQIDHNYIPLNQSNIVMNRHNSHKQTDFHRFISFIHAIGFNYPRRCLPAKFPATHTAPNAT